MSPIDIDLYDVTSFDEENPAAESDKKEDDALIAGQVQFDFCFIDLVHSFHNILAQEEIRLIQNQSVNE